MTSTALTLRCQRSEFSLPEDLHYLNCAYMSPLPKQVEAAGTTGVRRKSDPSLVLAEHFFDDSDGLRADFARLVGARDPRRVAIIPAVSYGMATVARNTPLERGQNVVLVGEQFPSDVYVWRRRCPEAGAELRTVRAPEVPAGRARAWNQALLEAIDRRTALVAVPNFHWSDGTRFDLEAVGARAREVGAAFVVDATQSVGAHPFDVERLRPDARLCAGYKTLFGPYSIGLAYYGARYDDGVPLEESWSPRRGSQDFAGLVEYTDEYQPGALRYDVGERSNFILVPMLRAAIAQIEEWGVESIRAYCRELTAGLFASVRELGYTVEDEDWHAAHLFGLRPPPGQETEAIRSALAARRVVVSVRGSAVRVSPHVYNDVGDIAALLEALVAAA